MSDQLSRVVDWLDDVLDWLREPLTRCRSTGCSSACAWLSTSTSAAGIVKRAPRMTAMIFDQPEAMIMHAATMDEFMAGQHRDCHPLSVWYDRTTSIDPQTCERVPNGLVPAGRRTILMAPLSELGFEQQMTIYYRREPTDSAFFVDRARPPRLRRRRPARRSLRPTIVGDPRQADPRAGVRVSGIGSYDGSRADRTAAGRAAAALRRVEHPAGRPAAGLLAADRREAPATRLPQARGPRPGQRDAGGPAGRRGGRAADRVAVGSDRDPRRRFRRQRAPVRFRASAWSG